MASRIPQTLNIGGDIDKCYTPPEATQLIVPYLKRLGVETIWEPAAGSGLMADILQYSGFKVYRTDIETSHDFLTYEPPFDFDAIVTNPPFAIDYKFVARAMEIGKPWAMLMKDNRSSVGRFRNALWDTLPDGTQVPPSKLNRIIPSRRISFKMPKQGWFTINKKTGKLENNSAQFSTYWYMYRMGVQYPEICVEYKQVDRLALRERLIADDYHGEPLERIIDLGVEI